MKRFATAALAAAMFATPVSLPTTAVAHERDRGWDRDRDRDWDRDDRRRHRRAHRREHRRWDRHSHNGYWYRERWYYGPPPVAYYDDPYFRPDYRSWRRGDRLPRYYRDHYHSVDWRYHRLRPPPRGYHYVRDDRGDYLLVGIATGIILGVILANN
jgi:Ni/Co efflux regulator RcnB